MDKAGNKTMRKTFHHILKLIRAYPYTLHIAALGVFTALMLLPFSMDKMNLFHQDKLPMLIYPVTIFSAGVLQKTFHLFNIGCYLFFLLPFTWIMIVVSFFYKKITPKIISIFSFTAITVYLSTIISGVMLFANTVRWFQALHITVYISFAIAFLFHIFLIARGIRSIRSGNESYTEYQRLLRDEERNAQIMLQNQARQTKSAASTQQDSRGQNNTRIRDILFSLPYIRRFDPAQRTTHVKTKITFIILFTISMMLFVFIYTDLKNYKLLLTQNVNTTGSNLAEQVAAIYTFSDGLHAKISAFLEGIKKTNESSPFPHQRVDIITTDSKMAVLLEHIDSATVCPAFNVFSYTTESGSVRNIPAEEKRITAEDAAAYIQHYRNERTRRLPIYKPEKGTYIYVYPITFSRKDGHKLVGFSVVTYFKEILDRPYFQAKVFVLALSAVFLYAAIIITLFLSDVITDPLILLCGNIRKTTNILSDILSGTAKIDAEKLTFAETIKTHDEIKHLSIEIKNIITLIRGMLPYVSFHTIRNAEKEKGSRGGQRDLCFLFTDIRGFTSLCENMNPREVIAILNRYLDIETQIIFNNGGDIDKYVGDEMMAFFSGPRKELNACRAAIEIREALHKEQQSAIKAGKATVSLGIGINSGTVVFGPVGSETRKDFTSIGDTVNLAARLEGVNKVYGSKTVISESVYAKLRDNFICRELDYITVKGKAEVVRIFEVLQATEKITNERIYDLKNLFETGLHHYRRREWQQASRSFSDCVQKYNDKPSQVFLDRITHYQISPPPADWTGVFVMNVK